MKLTRKYPLLGSSANPEQISLTIKGMAVWLVPMIIAVSSIFGLDFVEADLTQAINLIASIIAGGMMLYGMGRKYYYKFKK